MRQKLNSLKGYVISQVKVTDRGYVEVWGKKEGEKLSKLIMTVNNNHFFDGEGNYFQDQ